MTSWTFQINSFDEGEGGFHEEHGHKKGGKKKEGHHKSGECLRAAAALAIWRL